MRTWLARNPPNRLATRLLDDRRSGVTDRLAGRPSPRLVGPVSFARRAARSPSISGRLAGCDHGKRRIAIAHEESDELCGATLACVCRHKMDAVGRLIKTLAHAKRSL